MGFLFKFEYIPKVGWKAMAAGLEHEVKAGIMSTNVTRMPYCICYVRHIDGIEYHLNNKLARKYVDVIGHNNMRTIDRVRNRRLQELKVVSVSLA